jgi:hypothetical protein
VILDRTCRGVASEAHGAWLNHYIVVLAHYWVVSGECFLWYTRCYPTFSRDGATKEDEHEIGPG